MVYTVWVDFLDTHLYANVLRVKLYRSEVILRSLAEVTVDQLLAGCIVVP